MSRAIPGRRSTVGWMPSASAARKCGKKLSTPKRNGTALGGDKTIAFEPPSSCDGTIVNEGAGRCAATRRLISLAVASGISPGTVSMPTVPGDIPLATASEISRLVAAHRPAPSFTIVPSHDEGGSNAIVLSPPNAVPLRFGVDSFFPHLRAAEALGIQPTVLRLPGIALDIDNPADLAAFALQPSPTRTRAFLAENAMLPSLSRARMQL